MRGSGTPILTMPEFVPRPTIRVKHKQHPPALIDYLPPTFPPVVEKYLG